MTLYVHGDRVFAKVRGYPPWPARIDTSLPCFVAKGKYPIFFYGTYETYTLLPKDLYRYEKYKEKFAVPCKRPLFNKGLWQIENDPNVVPGGNDTEELLIHPSPEQAPAPCGSLAPAPAPPAPAPPADVNEAPSVHETDDSSHAASSHSEEESKPVPSRKRKLVKGKLKVKVGPKAGSSKTKPLLFMKKGLSRRGLVTKIRSQALLSLSLKRKKQKPQEMSEKKHSKADPAADKVVAAELSPFSSDTSSSEDSMDEENDDKAAKCGSAMAAVRGPRRRELSTQQRYQQKIEELLMEKRIVEADFNIKEALDIDSPDIPRVISAMNDLLVAVIEPKIFLSFPTIIRTIGLCRRYARDSTVCAIADRIYFKFKNAFSSDRKVVETLKKAGGLEKFYKRLEKGFPSTSENRSAIAPAKKQRASTQGVHRKPQTSVRRGTTMSLAMSAEGNATVPQLDNTSSRMIPGSSINWDDVGHMGDLGIRMREVVLANALAAQPSQADKDGSKSSTECGTESGHSSRAVLSTQAELAVHRGTPSARYRKGQEVYAGEKELEKLLGL